MAHRDAGEADACRFARAADSKRRLARIIAIITGTDLGRERGDVGEQRAHFACGLAAIQRGDEFDRLLQLFKVGGKLGFDIGIEHGVLLA
jgi:hypothetical protein